MTRLGSVLLLTLSMGVCMNATVRAATEKKAQPDGKDSEGTPAPPGPWQHPPKFGPPQGKVIHVRTEAQLQEALTKLRSNTTVLIAPGTYELTRSLHIGGGVKNVVLRGDSEDRNQVVLKGRGMRRKDYGNVPHGILVNDARDVVIANLAVGDVWNHPITLQGPLGCQRVRIRNVRLFDAGQQFLKGNPDGKGGGVDDCIVEYCVFEFTDTAREAYTQGMSIHRAANWIVRNNLFRNIRGPEEDPGVGGCIDFWNGSRNTTVEGNLIVNCRMGIRFGLMNRKESAGFHDHEGGVIRNNVIWRQPGAVHSPDAGILVWDSPKTMVLHNTVILNGSFPHGAIDCRWGTGLVLANNLMDAPLWLRDEASGQRTNNVTFTLPTMFVNVAQGDLHLTPKAQTILGTVPALAECPTDLDGHKRGARTTIGAVEFANRR
jgi:hypothetical protein